MSGVHAQRRSKEHRANPHLLMAGRCSSQHRMLCSTPECAEFSQFRVFRRPERQIASRLQPVADNAHTRELARFLTRCTHTTCDPQHFQDYKQARECLAKAAEQAPDDKLIRAALHKASEGSSKQKENEKKLAEAMLRGYKKPKVSVFALKRRFWYCRNPARYVALKGTGKGCEALGRRFRCCCLGVRYSKGNVRTPPSCERPCLPKFPCTMLASRET